MDKVPFNVILIADNKLFSKVRSSDDLINAMDCFSALLKLAGWTEEEYDKTLLSMIDKGWADSSLN